MSKTKNGSIFAVPLPDGTFIHGRVMLDIHNTVKRRLLPHDSPLLGVFSDAYLVEMYSKPTLTSEYVQSPVLIPGAFVDPTGVDKKWKIVGKQSVNPQQAEFPESLIG